MKWIVGLLMTIILIICAIPFIGPEVKIEWTMYLGLPLVILAGSAGVTFITKRFEAIICGAVIAALWPVLLELMHAV